MVASDGGALYDQWSKLEQAQSRSSSHYKDVDAQQYEIDFPPHGALLFGKDPSGNTWFQMENHGFSDPWKPGNWGDAIGHADDYVTHKTSGNQNVGPFGLSPHSEKEGRQLKVNYPPPT